ncbi:PEP-CTERM sorting domain-containing protein [Coleofasciculus sp. F4-SAH-05]|uniref:PEP-CTERM sorting domain-containing protein n=1 Tax=Coleofasciculus TaxID=669368 RepID=UPI0032FAE34E
MLITILKQGLAVIAGTTLISFASAGRATAADFRFSFTNSSGNIPGTVEGLIEGLPMDSGGLPVAASNISITSAPPALATAIDANYRLDNQNKFIIDSGQIIFADFDNFFNPDGFALGLALNSGFSNFLTAPYNFSRRVEDSSRSVTFTPVLATPASAQSVPEPTSVLGLIGVGVLVSGSARKRRDSVN